jgi:hypothetical protein
MPATRAGVETLPLREDRRLQPFGRCRQRSRPLHAMPFAPRRDDVEERERMDLHVERIAQVEVAAA